MSNSDRFSSKSVAQRVLIVLLLLFLLSNLIQPVQGEITAPNATFTVNNNGDSPDADLDDGVCDTNLATPSTYECSLRAAIQQANAPNTGHDTILFSGWVSIPPGSELPALTNTNGTTIYSDDHIWLLGTNPSSGDGLTLASNNNKVMGLVIAGFDNGVVVNGHYNVIGTDGDGVNDTTEMNVIYSNDDGTGYGIHLTGTHNEVAGNTIGLTTNGEDPGPNTTGIMVSGDENRIGTNGDGTSDTIERNVISGNSQHGIDISGDDNVVAGNYIGLKKDGDEAQGNGSNGIDIDPLAANIRIGTDSDGSGDAAERNIISGNGDDGVKTKGDYVNIIGNYIGTDATGGSAIPNSGYGVAVGIGAYETIIGTNGDGSRDSIEGNTISGNTTGGVEVSGNIHDTRIAGNKIGTNPTGTASMGNVGDGIYADGIGDELVIGTNGDGTADVSERNIISGNGQDGVHISTDLTDTVVAGNHIGTNAMGNAAIGNGGNGVLIDGGANHSLIGTDEDGTADALERNLISGNGGSGVRIEGIGSNANQLAGNYIGTNASGNSSLPNLIGVRVDDQAADTWISPNSNADLGNLISGNTNDGIHLGANVDSTIVERNIIGLNYLGAAALPNGRNGIYLTAGAFDSGIKYNTIARNTGAGIYLTPTAGSGNYYAENRIFANGGLGVDLAPIGVNPNDPGDADSGPNDQMNYPIFTRLVTDGSFIAIEGKLDSEPDTNFVVAAYTVEICDPSGYGEGGGEGAETNIGSTGVKTDSNGMGVFSYAFGGYSPDRPYMVLSTGLSEFSECTLIETDPEADMARLSIADTSMDEGDSGSIWMDFEVTLDRTATITVTVEYGMSAGSAKSEQDFIASWGALSFPPGSTQQTIQAEILGDTAAEPHETFNVILHSPVGALIQDSQAVGTILDDDGGGGYFTYLPLSIR